MPNITFNATGNMVRTEGVRVFGDDSLIYLNNTNDTWRGINSAHGVYSTGVTIASDGTDTTFTFTDTDDVNWFSHALRADLAGLIVSPVAQGDGNSTAGVRLGVGTSALTDGIASKAFAITTNVCTFAGSTLADLNVSAGTDQRLHLQFGVNTTIDNITGHNDNTDIQNDGQPTRFVDYWVESGFSAHGTNISVPGEALILSGSSANKY